MPVNNPSPSSSSGAGTTIPTTMQGDLTVAANTQMIFRQPIQCGAGQVIYIGANAALIGV